MKTELLFILDRSGSMGGLETDTIGGFNSLLEKQRKLKGEATVTTLLFDHEVEVLHDRMSIEEVAPITENDYFVRGTTALLDAIGYGIHKIRNRKQNKMYVETKVLVVITTDGMENASKEFKRHQVRSLIEEQKSLGWEFIFLGANIDAISTAEQFGIHRDYAVNYHADKQGTELNFASINEAVSSVRNGKKVSRDWKEAVEQDYQSRQ